MKTSQITPRLSILAVIAVTSLTASLAAWVANRPAPGHADLKQMSIKVVQTRFVAELEGTQQKFATRDPNAYRGIVLTLEISKPAGVPVTLYAPDLSLHYYHGEDFDVVQCYGLSGFSTVLETDRPMNFLEAGYGRSNTGDATTRAEKVYADVFFQDLEPDTTDLYLFIGQPAVPPVGTKGWQPE